MVKLRELEENDKTNILTWRNSEDVSRFMYTDHVITQEEHDRWFKRAIRKENGLHWIIEFEQQDVGLASITHLDHVIKRCSTGFYLVNPDVRGKGVGTFVKYSLLNKCFEQLQMEKVYSEHFIFNEAIIKLNEKMGYQKEGHFRKHAIKNGSLQDVIYMGILAEEWSVRKADIDKYLVTKGLL